MPCETSGTPATPGQPLCERHEAWPPRSPGDRDGAMTDPIRHAPQSPARIHGSLNAWTPLPVPVAEIPEPTNTIRPTGVAPEFTDPGSTKRASNRPVRAS
jgi:hypothetical protein